MPRAPKKCANLKCETRGTGRYCDQHQPMNWKGDVRTSTKEHKAWRSAVLKRDLYQCQLQERGCLGSATIADHIINVKAGGAEHDVNNGQAACQPCHTKKTQRESAAARRRARAGTPSPG